MRINVDYIDELNETEINIRCKTENALEISKILKYLKALNVSIKGVKDGNTFFLSHFDIYYIECVEDRTFIYLKNDVYESKMRLYEFEEVLSDTSFVRAGKSVLLNTDKLRCVRSLLSGKLEATLNNNEKILINRHYVPEFKKKFGL